MPEQKAQILLEVAQAKLKASLNKAQTAVSNSIRRIQAKAVAGVGKALKGTAKLMGGIAKRLAMIGAVVGGALLAGSLKAAATQEKADKLLAVSLKNVGEEGDAAFIKLKNFAGELQKITVHGDEGTQELMALALAMGVTVDEMEGATKGAIGLAKSFKIDLSASMKMVALGINGDFNMLQRFIPALKSATSQAEKLAIMNQAMADGFVLAQAETETAEGKMMQLKNTMGDVGEKIGQALLPVLSDLFGKMQGWLSENEEQIGKWSKSVVENVTKAANAFREFHAKATAFVTKVALKLFVGVDKLTSSDKGFLEQQLKQELQNIDKELEKTLKNIQNKQKKKQKDLSNQQQKDTKDLISLNLKAQEKLQKKQEEAAAKLAEKLKKQKDMELRKAAAEAKREELINVVGAGQGLLSVGRFGSKRFTLPREDLSLAIARDNRNANQATARAVAKLANMPSQSGGSVGSDFTIQRRASADYFVPNRR